MPRDHDEMMAMIELMAMTIEDTWRDPEQDKGLWTGAFRAAEHNPRSRLERWVRSGRFVGTSDQECLELALRIKRKFPEFGP